MGQGSNKMQRLIAEIAIEAALNDKVGYVSPHSSFNDELQATSSKRPKDITKDCASDCSGCTCVVVAAGRYIAGHGWQNPGLNSSSFSGITSYGFKDMGKLAKDDLLPGDLLQYSGHVNINVSVGKNQLDKWSDPLQEEQAAQAANTNSTGNTNSGLNSNEDGSNVSIFGDSITVGSKEEILKLLPNASIDAAENRQFSASMENVRNARKIVVYALGTNTDYLTQNLVQQVVDKAGKERIVIFLTNFSTNGKPNFTSNNAIFKKVAEQNSNVFLGDWAAEANASTDFFDNVHPNATGRVKFAQVIANAVHGSNNGGSTTTSQSGQNTTYPAGSGSLSNFTSKSYGMDGFILPIEGGYSINSVVGKRSGVGSSYHPGTDIGTRPNAGESGRKALACFNGVVKETYWSDSYGYCVILQLSNGFYAQYSHLESISVKAGQQISGGQQVGIVGCTGSGAGADKKSGYKTGGRIHICFKVAKGGYFYHHEKGKFDKFENFKSTKPRIINHAK